MTETLHRHDPGGPEAAIDCADGRATATWDLPAGQLLQDHPELNTGGYVYFTLDSEPTNVIVEADGGDIHDFSGWDIPENPIMDLVLRDVEPGVVYRAHILLAYEDGPTWHNDTRFTCGVEITETPVVIEVETLPETGLDLTGLLLVGSLLLVGGLGLLRRAWPWD